MDRKVMPLAIAAAALLLSLSGACSTPETPAATEAPSGVQITDQLGRTVRFDSVPQRIISLAPSNTEIAYALGLEDRLVAVTKYCDYPPEAREKPNVGGYTTPDLEQIVALSPDLVLVTGMHEESIIPQLEDKGITAFALGAETLEEAMLSIELAGEISGQREEAAALLADMESRIEAVMGRVARIPEEEKPAVFYLVWHDPLKTSGTGTLHDELIRKAGGRNLFLDVTGSKSVDLESIISRNPQVMIAGTGMGSGTDQTLTYLQDEERLRGTDAAASGSIYGAHINLTGRAGPRIVEGLEIFARCIHPEMFGSP